MDKPANVHAKGCGSQYLTGDKSPGNKIDELVKSSAMAK
jgi:hypothetical protein